MTRIAHVRKDRMLLVSGIAALAMLAGPLAIDLALGGGSGLVSRAHALKPGCDAPPCGPGGDGGQGGPGNPGGGGKPTSPGSGKGALFADLIVVLRDQDGLPLLDGNGCVQPITAAPVANVPAVTNLADGKLVSLIPLGGAGEEGEECDISTTNPDYTLEELLAMTQEVLFGRLNVGRSPDKVLAQQLREVTDLLDSSEQPILLDEAGRFVVTLDGAESAIDSPGNNLAMHQELQVEGGLLSQSQVPIALPPPGNPNVNPAFAFLDHAAAVLGAAAGKGDTVNLDLVVYDNRILGIPDETLAAGTLPTLTGDGVNGENGEVYVDYAAAGYSYARANTFPGCMNGLLIDEVAGTATPFKGTVLDCVFGDGSLDAGGVCQPTGVNFTGATPVHGFAQRADDARAVVAFVHSHVVFNVDRVGDDTVCDGLSALPPFPAP